MRIIFPTILFSVLLACSLPAQVTHYQIRFVATDPTTGAACTSVYITVNRTTGVIKGCVAGAWAVIGGGGGGSTNGTVNQILTSDGAGGFGTALTKNAANGPVVLDGSGNGAITGALTVGSLIAGTTLLQDGEIDSASVYLLALAGVSGNLGIQEGTVANTPSSGFQALYVDSTTHHLNRINSAGSIVDIDAGGALTSANVISKWSGTCDSSHVLMGDGTCAAISSAFSAVTAGTNAAALVIGSGGTLTYGGTGTIDANKLMGTALSGITGLAKLTAGVPSAAVAGTDYAAASGTYSLGTGYLSGTKTAGSGGVTANLLVKIDSTGNVVTAATSDVGILGIAATTAIATASVEVVTRGIVPCVADNTTVIGNIAISGTSTGGRCRDSGQTASTSIAPTTQVLGKFLSVASAGSTASLQYYGPGHYGTQFATVATSGLASDLTGSLADARLSANVALLNGSTAFTAAQAFPAGSVTVPGIFFGTSTQTGFYGQAANRIGVTLNGTLDFLFVGGETRLKSAELLNWSSGSPSAAGGDTGLVRNAAGVVEVNNGSAGTYRDLKLRSLVTGGTVPGISGCTAGTQTGGATAGTYSSGTTGTCTVVLTFAFTAPTGWSCMANDRTTPADLQNQTASSTTTATISGATISGDVVNYQCVAY